MNAVIEPSGRHLLFLSMKVVASPGMSLTDAIEAIAGVMNSTPDFLYKFKVACEPHIIAVASTNDLVAFERKLTEIYDVAVVEINSSPLADLEDWAKMLDVDSALTTPSPRNVTNSHAYWFYGDRPGSGNMDELLEEFKREAAGILQVRQKNDTQIDAFKVLWENRIHVFLYLPTPADVQKTQLSLRMFQSSRAGTCSFCKLVHQLDDFLNSV